MRLPMLVASILCSLTLSGPSHADTGKKSVNSRKLGLAIKVEGDGWGTVQKEKIETVLYAVADELLSRLPKKLAVPIVVTHTESSPIVLYEPGPRGEYRVQLHASDENWHLYTYEFAHELCHILSNYEENIGPGAKKSNQWFEETLCETASLFALKNLATTWGKSPATQEWSNQAGKLSRFFELLITEGHRQLPPHSPLAIWLESNEERLRQDPYLREKNEVVANLLLPLFERNQESWSTLPYLNLDPGDARSSLQDYLHHWYHNAPTEHKTFIADVLGLFEIHEVISLPSAAEKTLLAAASSPRPAALTTPTNKPGKSP